jgi:catechol 2,3-dioxygenase-like lactoylglutathione lyase family enzyme
MSQEVKHLHLASGDHAAAQRFYGTYFGFRFDAVFPRGDEPAATIIRSPSGFQIFLEGPSGERLPAWFHFGFFVESAAACRELHDRMQHDGVPIVRPFVLEPFANYFLTDPDGHLVQVYFDPKAL